MKTNRTFSVLRLLVLGILVAGFNAKPAGAQDFQGDFALPSATRWGVAELPAGDYSLEVYTGNPAQVIVRRGTNCVAVIVGKASTEDIADRTEMFLENGAVRKLSLPKLEIAVEYPAAKPHHRAAPKEVQAAQIIPVVATRAGR